ncbi:MAG: hypothetical protein J6X16_01035 [Bacteroidales bacterium]|nr:hypothetical protein [Bacteroidales bacterium]
MKKIILILLIWLCGCGMLFAQSYHIGDLYTAPDGSQGIVYYLHPDGSGGWVVALTDASTGCFWGDLTDVPGLTNLSTTYLQTLLNDTASYTNTQILRSYQNDNNYAAGVVDFDNGWVLPSLAQLSMLYAQLPFISSAIVSAGGATPIYSQYWSCSERDASNAWTVYFFNGYFEPFAKHTYQRRVRAVRSFTYSAEADVSHHWNTGDTTQNIVVIPMQTTTYSVTVITPDGGSDTAQHTIVVNTPVSEEITQTACDSYEWNGQIYTESSDYTQTFTASNGCDSVVTLHLTIGYSTHNIEIVDVCDSYTWHGTTYTTSGIYQYDYTDASGCPCTDTLHLTMNYGAHTVETVTACGSYEWHGETYTTSGAYIYTYTNDEGCVSTETLQLSISNMPEVSIAATDSVICEGDSVTLQASASAVYIVPAVAVGDILCTDGTTVKPDDFLASGKTAMGVVFYVDSTGVHGWAVHLHDQGQRVRWSNNTMDVPGVSNFDNFYQPGQYPDYAGYANTQSLWVAGDSLMYPAAHCVDFPHGWYLPDIGQLDMLYSEMPFLTPSLELVGGEPFPTNSTWYYWSSTESAHEGPGYAWHVESNGRVDYCNKTSIYFDYYSDFSGYSRVRGIRDF